MMPKPSLAAILVCGFLATGCRSAQRKEEVCLGNEFLGVRNETGESVDIYIVTDGLQRIGPSFNVDAATVT